MLIKVTLFVAIYTVVLTILTENFDPYYIAMVEKNTCFFLLPVWDFLPSLVIFASLRIFLAWKIRQTSSLNGDSSKDYFGISNELKYYNVIIVLLMIAYSSYTYHFLVEESDSELSKAGQILTANCFASVLFTVLLPVLKVCFAKHKHRRNKRIFRRIAVSSGRRSTIDFEVRSIWCDSTLTKRFREHAQRSLCAENVDFCIEVTAYKNLASCLNESTREEVVKENLHKLFVKISKEFVCDNSPSEVNISSSQKSHILQKMDPESFHALDATLLRSIFDEAQAEIEKVLQDNLSSSFPFTV